ncbi:MAG: LysM domain-containing protein [Pseudomonadota bacterium]
MFRHLFAASMIASIASAAHANICGLYEAIEPGDTLTAIASRCDTSVDALIQANPGTDPQGLQIGGVLRLTPASPDENARAIYRTLLGLWSEDGICFGKEVIVSFEEDSIGFGETGCDLAALEIVGDAIVLKATACLSEGEPSGSQTLTLIPQPDGSLSYSGQSDWTFRRCSDL